MLAGLRHHPVVGSHHQQHQIDALRSGQHVVGEALMTGYVDKTGEAGARLQRGIEVTEVDGHATLTLFPASVAGLPGQCLEQCGLAVIDVPCGTDDHSAASPACN